MKREIKFRAWDEGNKIMHNDFQFIRSGNDGNDWIIFISDKQTLDWDELRIENRIHPFNNPFFQQQLNIMQFTGLKDKNFKEIWEGDIVQWVTNSDEGLRKINEVVTYMAGAFQIIASMPPDEFEVIGNIYENPELL